MRCWRGRRPPSRLMRATLLATIEPVTATISSVLWTGSVFTPVDIVGFVLILIMSFLVQ